VNDSPFLVLFSCLHMIAMMSGNSPDFTERLRAAGLRPTRQRVALARVLFEGGHRHVTAESLHAEVKATRMPVSLATVYNALNQFRDAGHHHHFYVEPDGELHDFPSDKVTIAGLPSPPKGTRLSRVDVIVRVHR